ncbi:hypothetical protein KAR91_83760 [Candidatus Pacearchaeota archaeon]|nr:hypothetical protein [Candidatus Pacearchaeota archaeon]
MRRLFTATSVGIALIGTTVFAAPAYDYKDFKLEIETTLVTVDTWVPDGEKLYSPTMVELLLGTAAVESSFGQFLIGPSDDRGVFQVRVSTIEDMRVHFFPSRRNLEKKLDMYSSYDSIFLDLERSTEYSIVAAAIHYRRVLRGKKIPKGIWNQARIWKKYFNTHLGAGTIKKFVTKASYRKKGTN